MTQAFGTYIVLLQDTFGWSKTALAAASSLRDVENGVMGPVQGFMLDRFGAFGKPLHVTLAGVPSNGGAPADGEWRGPWSPALQGEWMREVFRIALSKPFIETVSAARFADATESSGLLDATGRPKPAFEEILRLRREINEV